MEVTHTLPLRFSRCLALLLAVFASSVFAGNLQAQTIPIAVVSSTQTVVPAINGNAGHVAANTAGDAFYVSQGDNIAYWLPRGRTTPIALVTGLSGGRSVYVDSKNNVFVPSNYGGFIVEVPYVNGNYATGIAAGSTSACSTTTPIAPCQQFGSGSAVTSYYYQPTDLGFDSFGNAYVIDEYNQTGPSGANKNNGILKWTPSSTGYTASYLIQTLPQNNSAQIAVGPLGDVYYADGSGVYTLAAGTKTLTTLTNNLTTNPAGVTTDQYGNLFITNASTPYGILEMPALNGTAVPSKQFTFSQGYSANGIAFDGLGNYFSTAYNNATNLTETALYGFNLGSAAIGKPSTATALTISLLFTGNATPATIAQSGATAGFTYVAGTCAAGTAYNAGSSCTVNATFTPVAPGLQRSAIVLADSTGKSIVTVSLSGTGQGAQLTSDPGTLTSIGTGLKTPQSIAVDSSNNVYLADPGQNAVLRYAAGSTTSTSVGTGLSKPSGVAVDGAGNVFIADSGNGRIILVPNQNGTLAAAAQSTLATSYTGPITGTAAGVSVNFGSSLSLAIDGKSNLYVADANNAQVVRFANIDGIPNAASNSLVPVTVSGGKLTAPSAVATDTAGNVFIADTTGNAVYEVLVYGKGTLAIGSGYSHPSGLATDSAGSLYVADAGNNRLLKIPFESTIGIYNTNDQYGVGSTVATPFGVATDGSSNLYVVDNANAAAYFLNRAQGTLPIGRTNINTTSSTLNGYVANSGTLPFTLGTPDYVATGNTAVFSVMSPSGNGCTNAEVIAAGYSCVLNASFSPTVVGNFSETLAFTSNAGFPAGPSLTLTGLGLNLAPTTLKLAQTSPAGTAAFGQSITVTATITSTKTGTPTGTLTVFVDGGSGVSVMVNGFTASVTLSGLTGGPHTLAASYTGDNNFAPSNTTLGITVAQTGTATTLAASGAGVYQNPASAQPGTAITLTATVVPTAATIPTGSVTFTAGGVTLGTGGITNKNGIYLVQISTSALPTGNVIVTATYSGDVNYQPSSGNLLVVLAPMSYTLTPLTNSLTIGTLATGYVSLQVSSIAGYTGYVGLVCTGLPANTQCGFSPNGLILQANNLLTAGVNDPTTGVVIVPPTFGVTPVTVTVNTGITPTVPQPPIHAIYIPLLKRSVPVTWALLGFAPLALAFRRKSLRKLRSLRMLSMVLILAASGLFFSGCGSNLVGVTPPGTYNVTITATSTASGYSGTLAPGCSAAATCTQTVTLTLVVQ